MTHVPAQPLHCPAMHQQEDFREPHTTNTHTQVCWFAPLAGLYAHVEAVQNPSYCVGAARVLSSTSTYVCVDVSAAEDDLVVVNQPDVLVNHVAEVVQAATRLIDEEANSLQYGQHENGERGEQRVSS